MHPRLHSAVEGIADIREHRPRANVVPAVLAGLPGARGSIVERAELARAELSDRMRAERVAALVANARLAETDEKMAIARAADRARAKRDDTPAPVKVAKKDETESKPPSAVKEKPAEKTVPEEKKRDILAETEARLKKVQEMIAKGEKALDDNQPELAARYFQRALALAPEHDEAKRRLNYARQMTATVGQGGIISRLERRRRIARQAANTEFDAALKRSEELLARAAQFDPDINQAWVVNVGYDSPAAINKHWETMRSGKLPTACPNAAVNSLFDPTDAPEGHYTGLLRHFAPYNLNPGGPEAWDQMAKEFAVSCIEKWQEAAPNLKDGAILDWATYSPLDISRRIANMVQGDWMGGLIDLENMLDQRPFAELSQYQTPVKNLYMCGATQPPHGFITFAPAYNALQVIADDYDLERWWR